MSAELKTLAPQAELALSREPSKVDMPIEIVRGQPTYAAAFTLACSASGLEDKEIYLALDIDAGYFSNIKKGKATLQGDLVGPFCRLVGNRILLDWSAFQVGCVLVLIQSEAERRAEVEKARADELARENRLLRDLVQGRAA
jgi:hypothetical protein